MMGDEIGRWRWEALVKELVGWAEREMRLTRGVPGLTWHVVIDWGARSSAFHSCD